MCTHVSIDPSGKHGPRGTIHRVCFGFEAIPSLAHLEDNYRWRDYRNVHFICKSAHACIVRFPFVGLVEHSLLYRTLMSNFLFRIKMM